MVGFTRITRIGGELAQVITILNTCFKQVFPYCSYNSRSTLRAFRRPDKMPRLMWEAGLKGLRLNKGRTCALEYEELRKTLPEAIDGLWD